MKTKKKEKEPLSPEAKKLLIFVGVLILLGLLAKIFLPGFLEQRKEEKQAAEKQEMTEYAGKVAGEIPRLFAKNINELEKMSQEAEVLALFQNYQKVEAEGLASKNSARFENTLKLRLLPPDIDQTDNEDPPLTFASLEMTRNAVKSNSPVQAEWHFPKQAVEHIVLVQRVNNEAGEAIGALHLSLKVDPVHELFKKVADSSIALTELRQGTSVGGSVVLATAGDKNRALPGQAVVVPIARARWTIKAQNYPVQVIDRSNLKRLGGLGLAGFLGWLIFWLRKLKIERDSRVTLSANRQTSRRTAMITPEDTGDLEEIIENMPDKDEEEVQQVFDEAEIEDEIVIDDEEIEVPEIDDIADNNDDVDEATNAPASIFRAYDIRGVVGDTLTEKIVYNIGRALGSEALARGDNTVVVGRDGRLSSPALSEALIKGLNESGRDVIDIGMVPTPVLYFGANYFDTTSGIMITGSHNPPDYNGIKMVLAGTTLADEAIQALRQRILENDYTQGEGKSQTAEIGSEYIRRITDDIPVAISNSFKVVVDSGNGVAGQLGPQLLRALGHDVVELFCEIDGNFPNHHPDPSQPENLVDLINAVKSEKADLGLAFDGDGDRLGVVDRDGNIIWPDRQMMLFARDVIERNPGGEIIFDVKCSNHLRRVIEEAGGKATMWKTGHSLIKAKMKETGALLAGEMSGHVFFKERWYGFDDGLYTAARLLEILVKSDQPPHEILGSLPGGVATPELKLDMHEDQHGAFMATLIELANFGEGEIGTIDGIRVDFPDGWGLIRPSNTTPCLVMRFEADNEAALERIQQLFKEQLLGLDPTLKLPY